MMNKFKKSNPHKQGIKKNDEIENIEFHILSNHK
jgi:hypothetical protein